jgi:hypothetical protein
LNPAENWIWSEWKWLREQYTEARLLCDIYGAPEQDRNGETLSLAERISILFMIEISEDEKECDPE